MTPAVTSAADPTGGLATLGGLEGKKYMTLRKRLDQLGYRQSLGVDSLPLVEKLFNDLVQTTESLKKSKQQATKVVHDSKEVENVVEPYALENARLLREQNELHKKLLLKNDEMDVTVRENKDQLRKLEHENADMKFLNSQYLAKVKQLEKDVKARDDKIKELQEKCSGSNTATAIVHANTSNGMKKKSGGGGMRRQRMDIDSFVVPEPGTTKTTRSEMTQGSSVAVGPAHGKSERGEGDKVATKADEAYMADMLVVADERIGAVQQELESVKNERDLALQKVESLKHQVEVRDEEIDRLSRLLETGRPHESIAADAKLHTSDKLVQHLNLQVEYLQNANRALETEKIDLESRLNAAIERKHDAAHEAICATKERNDILNELEITEGLAEKISLEKEHALNIADREVHDAKDQAFRSQTELRITEKHRSATQTENEKLKKRLEKTERDRNVKLSDLEKAEQALARAEKTKAQQQARIEELSKNERNLLTELEKMRLKKGGKPGQANGSVSPTRLNQMLKSIEQERDFYKKENEKLVKKSMREEGGRSASPMRSKEVSSSKSDKQVIQLESVVRALEDERDHYKREFERIKLSSDVPEKEQGRNRSPMREKMSTDVEVRRLTRENKELQAMLDKCERHMSEIKTNVKILTQENEKTRSLYEQANDEAQRLRRELMKSPKNAKASQAAQAILQRIENERDDALAELRRTAAERDALRDKLANEQSCHVSNKARLESEVEELYQRLRPVEAERDELMRRVASLREMVASLEDQVNSQSLKIRGVEDEAHEFKGESNQLRMLVEQTEKSLQETRYKLDKRNQELGICEDARAKLEIDLHSTRAQLKKEKEEVQRLKGIIASLDHEKDALQCELDLKVEKIASLNSDLDNKAHQINSLNAEVGDNEQQILNLNDAIAAREREIKSLRRQLDSKTYEVEEISRLKDSATIEIKRLQEDLGEMTRECQSLSQQLTRTEEERDELKGKLMACHKELQRQEDVIAAQEQEKNHLLSSYRQAQTESSRHENDSQTYQTELSSARLEIVSKEGEIRRLEDRIREMDREIKEYQESTMQYESQLSKQSTTMGSLENQIKSLQHDKDAVLSDLAAVRELCVKLDSTKDSLQRKLAQKNIEADQLMNQLEDCRQEVELLKKQCESESQTIKNLEDLLTANREKEFASQLSSQEKETELQLYKERLSLSENKSGSLQREIQSFKTRLGTCEAELERCRRQLTNERFERERVEQDLRRIKQGRYSSPTRKPTSTVSWCRGFEDPVEELQVETSSYELPCSLCGQTKLCPKRRSTDDLRRDSENRD